MNTSPSYTPLECLLFFQSLLAYGTDIDSFERVSYLLKNNALVKDGDTYDPSRLSEHALRELYLRLLGEELKGEGEQDGQDGDAQPTSRKRKLQSPALPTVKDAQEDREKLSVLVERLYSRYVDHMIRTIGEDERRYEVLRHEIAEIERGEWDERILKDDETLVIKNGRISPVGPQVERENRNSSGKEQFKISEAAVSQGPPAVAKDQEADQGVPIKTAISPEASPRAEIRAEGLAIDDVLNGRGSSAPDSPRDGNRIPRNGPKNIQAPNAQISGSSGPLGPHGASPLHTGNQQSGNSWKWEPPYQAGQHPSPYPPSGSHPQFNSSQYPPPPQTYPPPPRGLFSSAHGLPPPHPHLPSSPLHGHHPHPILLPPPNTILRSPGSPAMPLDALADIAGQQYRAPSGSPMQQGPSSPGGFVQPHAPPQNAPPSSGPTQWNRQYMPPYNSPSQQYHFPQHSSQRNPLPPRTELVSSENRQYNSPYNASHVQRPPMPLQPQNLATSQSRPSLPNTPISQSIPRYMTGSGTRWTPTPTGSTPRPYKIAEPPAVEPLSPILRPKHLPESDKKPTKRQTQRMQPPKAGKAPLQRSALRTGAGRTTSSVLAESYRSQSVHSHADELSIDNELASRHVKQEVATPRGVDETGDTTADEESSRRRRGTLRDALPPRQAMKRKRNDSVDDHEPSTSATHVLWTRAFPKISASALESISGHRNASTFALPVKIRNAPGYRDLILRPQDLKSIRSAITAGNRAAAAAAPDDQTQSSVWLPVTEDLIPPKGIINYAQLEKELMRMFANAIMFNADPDRGFGRKFERKNKAEERGKEGYEIDENGVVKDTRAMYMDVEKVVGSLRSAERRSEEFEERDGEKLPGEDNDVDELAGDVEGITGKIGSIAKRRKKA